LTKLRRIYVDVAGVGSVRIVRNAGKGSKMESVRGNIRESVGSGSIEEAIQGNTRVHLCNQVNEIPIVRTMFLPNLPPIYSILLITKNSICDRACDQHFFRCL